MRNHRFAPVLLAAQLAMLAGCASRPTGTPDNEPTLAALAKQPAAKPATQTNAVITATPEQAAAAYKRFLDSAPHAPQRADALRRLGDLAMDSADNQSADKGTDPDYKAAIARYQDYLKTYPNDPGNDRVLYQLARAYELGATGYISKPSYLHDVRAVLANTILYWAALKRATSAGGLPL